MEDISISKLNMSTNSSVILQQNQFHSIVLSVTHGLYLYLSPIFLVIGLTGSILTFSIMYEKAKSKATYLYLTFLSVIDVFALYIPCLRGFIYYLSNGRVDLTKTFKCGWFYLFYYSCTNISVYTVICVAIDRFISVYFPYTAKSLSTSKRAVGVCVVISIFQFVLNLHFVWTSRLVVVDGEMKCIYPEQHAHWMRFVWTWIDLSVFSFIPVTTLTTLSSLTIYKMAKQRKQIAASHNASTSMSKRSISISLITVCVVMLLCNTPIVVLNLLTPKLIISTPEQEAGYGLAMAVVEHLMYLNNSINFFLYIVTTKHFRRELTKMLRLDSLLSAMGTILGTTNSNTVTSHTGQGQCNLIILGPVLEHMAKICYGCFE